MTFTITQNIQTKSEILAELKRREGCKTISFEEAYRRGKEHINNLGR